MKGRESQDLQDTNVPIRDAIDNNQRKGDEVEAVRRW